MASEALEARVRRRQVKLLPQGPYARFNEAYAKLEVALARAGKSPSDLSRNQIHTYWDLREPYHEYALAHLHDWWDYDQPHLMKRSRRTGGAKPRIALKAFITRPGNLSVEWEPDRRGGSDWTSFHRLSGYGPYRPSNELMYIREVKRLVPAPSAADGHRDRLIDAHLLACTGAAIECLERRLAVSFEVRWETAFRLDWAPQPKNSWISEKGLELLGWHIEDVVDRTQREERDQLEMLLDLTHRDAPGFVALLLEIDPKLTLDRLRAETGLVRLQKKLRQRGVMITPAPLGKLVQLLEEHHADLLRPLWRTVGGGLQVVK